MVTFNNFPLLLVSKLQRDISLSTLNSEYMELSHSVIELLPLKSIIKEVIDNLVIDSEKLNFLSISTVYKYNNGCIVVAKIPGINSALNHISFKYHWFRKHVGKLFLFGISSQKTRSRIFSPEVQNLIFSGLGICYVVGKPSDET